MVAVSKTETHNRFRGLGAYLAEAGRRPPLSSDEEMALARRYKETGDPEAVQRLMLANLRYVVKVAMEYRYYGCDMVELIQQGNLGLAEAIARFDPDRGTRLVTYASWWIRDAIRQAIVRSRSVSAKGTTRAERKLCGLSSNPDAPQRDVGLEDVRPNKLSKGSDPESELISWERQQRLKSAVSRALALLDERELEIVQNRFMADDPESLSSLGVRFGVSRERARQIAERAKRKLRPLLQEFTS